MPPASLYAVPHSPPRYASGLSSHSPRSVLREALSHHSYPKEPPALSAQLVTLSPLSSCVFFMVLAYQGVIYLLIFLIVFLLCYNQNSRMSGNCPFSSLLYLQQLEQNLAHCRHSANCWWINESMLCEWGEWVWQRRQWFHVPVRNFYFMSLLIALPV